MGKVFVILLFGFSFIAVHPLYAGNFNADLPNLQSHTVFGNEESKEKILERLTSVLEEMLYNGSEESAVGHAVAIEEIVEYFEQLLERPLPINSCSRGDLKSIILLTDFQVESILDYRLNSGDILSASELALINGFDEESVQLLLPFISFVPSSGSFYNGVRRDDGRFNSQLFFKVKRFIGKDTMYSPVDASILSSKPDCRYLGTPYYLQLRYKCEYGNRLQAGFTFENDAGERLFASSAPPVDFFSFHLAAKSIGKLNTLVLGDYTARFGQGLTLWKSFSLQGVSSPMALYKRGNVFAPYTSSYESDFCRGVAASFTLGSMEINAMFSSNMLDARVKDSAYFSIIEGGLHNTASSLTTRKTLNETIGGVNIAYMLSRLKLGVSFIGYGYNKLNGREIHEYNKYQMYNGVWGNCAVDFYAIAGSVKLFGEIAVDYGGSIAAILGAVFNISDKLESGVLLRSYSKSYISPHAGAYSTISSVSNQQGVTITNSWSISKEWRAIFGGEWCYYPWLRYNINTSSAMAKAYATLEYMGDVFDFTVRISDSYTSYNSMNKIYVKTQMEIKAADIMNFKIHGRYISAAESYGWQLGANIKYKSLNKHFSMQMGGSIFNCAEWTCRLYVHDPYMPYTYNSRLLYGNGCSIYALIKADVSKRVELYLKGETTRYWTNSKDAKSYMQLLALFDF